MGPHQAQRKRGSLTVIWPNRGERVIAIFHPANIVAAGTNRPLGVAKMIYSDSLRTRIRLLRISSAAIPLLV